MTDKHSILRILIPVVLLCSTLPALARIERVKIGVLYYLLDADTRSATVVHSFSNTYINTAGKDIADENERQNYGVGNITIPSSVTYNGATYTVNKIYKNAFLGSPIESVNIPSSVDEIGERAFSSSALKSVNIANPNLVLGDYAFSNCQYLNSVNLPDGLRYIPKNCFSSSGITSIKIPNTVAAIGPHVFLDCKSLENLAFPQNLTVIPPSTCEDCTSLHSVMLP